MFAEILRDYVLIISSCSCCMIKLPQVILYERRYICNLKISFIAIQKLQHRTNQHLLEHAVLNFFCSPSTALLMRKSEKDMLGHWIGSDQKFVR